MRNILIVLMVFGIFTLAEIGRSQDQDKIICDVEVVTPDRDKIIWEVEVVTPSGVDKFESYAVSWLQSGGNIVGIEVIDTNGFKRYYKSDRFSLISKKIYNGPNKVLKK